MAKNKGIVQFTGSIGGVSAYQMQGVDGIVVRQRKGVSRHRMKHDPCFKLTRLGNDEWAACSETIKRIGLAIHDVRHLANFNFYGKLMAVCKKLQAADTINPLGQRSIQILKAPHLLEGFDLNKNETFDRIMRTPLTYTLDRLTGIATVNIPPLIPGINLFNPANQPLYRFIAALGVVPDMIFNEPENKYDNSLPISYNNVVQATPWWNWKLKAEANQLELSLQDWLPDNRATLILSVGVEFGIPVAENDIRYTKYAGAARIIKVG